MVVFSTFSKQCFVFFQFRLTIETRRNSYLFKFAMINNDDICFVCTQASGAQMKIESANKRTEKLLK